MTNLNLKIFFSVLAISAATSCSRIQFKDVSAASQIDPQKKAEPTPFPSKPLNYVFEKELPLQSKNESFIQDTALDNTITLTFRAKDSEGFNINNVKKEDLLVDENQKNISDFSLTQDQQNIGKKVDVVIVLDVTNSMEETIQLVKEKVSGFVHQLEAKKWNSTLCLVTFRDDTVQTCSRIVEDDPRTPQNENLDYFLGELAKAKTKPSGDWDENQLKGLIDASEKTPWRDNAQRVEVLMTNSTFSYAPQNRGDAGDKAPTYEETVSVLSRKQINLFTVAPKAAGYSKAFSPQWSALHEIRGGSYFNFQKMLSGSVPLDQIFNSIIDRLATDYKLTYSSNTNGLDSELPLAQRLSRIQFKNSNAGSITLVQQSADWPSGTPEMRKKWKLSSPVSRMGLQKIYVNGVLVSKTDYSLDNSELIFKKAPKSQAQISIVYDTLDLEQSLSQFSFDFKSEADLLHSRWFINDEIIESAKLNVHFDANSNVWKIDFSKLTENDLMNYKVFSDRKLKIRLITDSSAEESLQVKH